jgi:hypothetical protein
VRAGGSPATGLCGGLARDGPRYGAGALIGRVLRRLRGPTATRRAQLAAILDFAEDLARERPGALVDLVRLLGRPVQADAVARILSVAGEPEVREITPVTLLFSTWEPLASDGRTFYDPARRLPEQRVVDLGVDPVLPWPWCRNRLVGTLAHIGEGRSWGPWTEDPLNHRLSVWLPMGLAWVRGGNHSLAAGLFQGRGRVTAREVLDVSAVYEHVVCDGARFLRQHDGRALGPVGRVEMAAVFEVGRLMVAHGVSA